MDVATVRQSRVGVREVKNHLSAYLDRVQAGEDIVITDRGRPVARLTAVGPEIDRLRTLIDQGLVVPAAASRSRPRRRVRATGSMAELVAAERR
jgi:prevent-host-death family protein